MNENLKDGRPGDHESITIESAFEERAEAMLSRVFRGMHHVHGLKKQPRYWTCIHNGDASTFDFNILTCLVFGAHEYCLRVSISNGGPRSLKIEIHPRNGREGEIWNRHPTIEQALEAWKK